VATSRKVTILDRADIVKLLQADIAKAGSQLAWAKKTGIERTFTNMVLHGTRAPSPKMIRALGLSIVVIAEPDNPLTPEASRALARIYY